MTTFCGVDPGVRTFMTTFGNDGCYEYNQSLEKLNNYNNKIDILKNRET